MQKYTNGHYNPNNPSSFYVCPGYQFGDSDSTFVYDDIRLQIRRAPCKVLKGLFTICTWPMMITRKAPAFWIIAWLLILICLPLAIVAVLVLYPIILPIRIC